MQTAFDPNAGAPSLPVATESTIGAASAGPLPRPGGATTRAAERLSSRGTDESSDAASSETARGSWATAALVLTLVVGIAVADVFTSEELSLSIFYAIPVVIAAWRLGRLPSLIVTAIAAALCVAIDIQGHAPYSHPFYLYWANFARFAFLAIVAVVVSRLRAAHDALARLARHDPLTGLLNRRGFVERASVELARARRAQRSMSMVLIDVDDFKKLNDDRGHEAGDEVLRIIGRVMSNVRGADVAVRLGGDEFGLLIPDAGMDGAKAVVARISDAATEQFLRAGLRVTLSLGVSVFGSPPADVDALIREADSAMYHVKRGTKDSVQYRLVG